MLKGQLANLMKQAQAMQDNMQQLQDELAHLEVDGETGAGAVTVRMNCKYEIIAIITNLSLLTEKEIDPETQQLIDLLIDLIIIASRAAKHKAEKTAQEKMAGLAAGLPLPPGFQLP